MILFPEIVMTRSFDAAVIGLGTMGRAVTLSLARRNASVIGFDRFRPPHSFGSHGGSTRVFRMAYPELPDYVPLALIWVGVQSVVPLPPAPLRYAPMLVAGWTLARVLLLWLMRRRGREPWLLRDGTGRARN